MKNKNPPAFALLKQQFPKAFSKVTPLKIGIHKEFFAILKSIPKPYSIRQCRRALYWYINRKEYLRRIVADNDRIDIDGRPCGKVTKAEEAYAKNQLQLKYCAKYCKHYKEHLKHK